MRLFFLFFPFFLFCDINIVFVHIGKNIPDYVSEALLQARRFNEDAPIYFLGNRDALRGSHLPNSIKTIALETLTPSHSHIFFSKNHKHSDSLEGFWQYTIERFFYLDELARQYKLKNIFHLENDVMLYRDLNELLPVFEKYYPSIGATFDADHRVIPGFMYFKNPISLSHLARHLSKSALRNLDMMSIASYRNSSRRKKIDFLPIIFPGYVDKKPLISSLGVEPEHPKNYWNHFKEFNSVFDAACIGQYLGGESPRNIGEIVPGFINETCVFNPSYLQYEWIEDSQGRKVPYINFDDKQFRINNLHIHSKKLAEFRS